MNKAILKVGLHFMLALALIAGCQGKSEPDPPRPPRLVIEARQHARWAAKRAGADQTKTEMMQWMLVWLENPAVFPAWASLRRQNW